MSISLKLVKRLFIEHFHYSPQTKPAAGLSLKCRNMVVLFG